MVLELWRMVDLSRQKCASQNTIECSVTCCSCGCLIAYAGGMSNEQTSVLAHRLHVPSVSHLSCTESGSFRRTLLALLLFSV